MRLELRRLYKKADYTIGKLYVNGQYVCDTLEDRVRDLSREEKVWGETAIPEGCYLIDLTISPKFKDKVWGIRFSGKVPAILDVPHFSGVRIHPGNKAKDTLGCPLVGYNKVKGGLVDSVSAYDRLMREHLMPAHDRGELIQITIS